MAGRRSGPSTSFDDSFNTNNGGIGGLAGDVARRFAPAIGCSLVSSVVTPVASAMMGAGAVLTAHGVGGSATGPALAAAGAIGALAGGVGITASVVSATRGVADFAGDFLETNFSEGCVRAASACTGTLGAISALATAGSGAMMGAGSAMLANSVGGKAAGIALTAVGALGVVASTGGRGG
jgi:hypothetical protein